MRGLGGSGRCAANGCMGVRRPGGVARSGILWRLCGCPQGSSAWLHGPMVGQRIPNPKVVGSSPTEVKRPFLCPWLACTRTYTQLYPSRIPALAAQLIIIICTHQVRSIYPQGTRAYRPYASAAAAPAGPTARSMCMYRCAQIDRYMDRDLYIQAAGCAGGAAIAAMEHVWWQP